MSENEPPQLGCTDVVMPRELAERIHEHLTELEDEGPAGSGWKSTELIADMNALADLLDLPKWSQW